MTRPRTALLVALALIAGAAALRIAAHAEMVDPTLSTRIVQIIIGLILVVVANGAPKQIGRARQSLAAEARVQSARRVAGWSLTLAGLAYAGLWALAPIDIARPLSICIVAIALLIAAVQGWRACRRTAETEPAAAA